MTTSREVSDEAMLQALRKLVANPVFNESCARVAQPQWYRPRNAKARTIAERLLSKGFLESADHPDGKPSFQITESGRDWVLEHDDPKLLLEDLLRASEEQCEHLRRQVAHHQGQCELLEAQCTAIRRVLARSPVVGSNGTVASIVLDQLGSHANADHPADATVAELFHQTQTTLPEITIGQFHDAVRSMHESGCIRLSPWTGPLYQLPEPALALLIGHEVLYYVQLARCHAA